MISVPDYNEFDADFVRNWNGTLSRQGNNNSAINMLRDNIHALIGKYPRVLFQKSQPLSVADNSGLDPLYYWRFLDNDIAPTQNLAVRIIAVPRQGTSYEGLNTYASRYGGTEKTFNSNWSVSSADLEDAFFAYYYLDVTRSNETIPDGISTFNGFTILSVAVVEDHMVELSELSDSVVQSAQSTQPIVYGPMADIRDILHQLRNRRLSMAFSWAACGITGTPAVPGDHTGIHVTSSTYVNLFDQSITTRDANSPGSCIDAQYWGIGPEDETTGQSCRVECEALAKSIGGASNVKFIGPTHSASNEVELEIPEGGPQWITMPESVLFLNTASAYDDATTARNKIDFHGKTSGTDLYVYGLRGHVVYGEGL